MYLYTNACTATSTDNGAMDYIYTAYVHVQPRWTSALFLQRQLMQVITLSIVICSSTVHLKYVTLYCIKFYGPKNNVLKTLCILFFLNVGSIA